MSADALRRAAAAQLDLVNDIAHQSAWGGYEFTHFSVRSRLPRPTRVQSLPMPIILTETL